MSRTRQETIVTIELGWAARGERTEKDIILPEGATDWFVTDYDGCESLWYVLDGKLYNEDHERIGHEGRSEEGE